jgi:hypothetical protein
MKKINKLQKISLIAIGILLLAGIGFHFKQKSLTQTINKVLPTPTVQATTLNNIAVPTSEDQVSPGAVTLVWKIPQADVYGFRISRTNSGATGYKNIAIFDPDPVGYAHISDGGFYTNFGLQKGTSYTYQITTFDRQGDESAPASVTITAQ